jgi:hypothetical protein
MDSSDVYPHPQLFCLDFIIFEVSLIHDSFCLTKDVQLTLMMVRLKVLYSKFHDAVSKVDLVPPSK